MKITVYYITIKLQVQYKKVNYNTNLKKNDSICSIPRKKR